MFRIILRISLPTINVMQLFLKGNKLFTGSWKSPKLARYRYRKLFYRASQSDLVSVNPKINHGKDYRPVVLLSGILTWFGSKKEERKDEAIRLYNEALKYSELREYRKCVSALNIALKAAMDEHDNDLIITIWELIAEMYVCLGFNDSAELALLCLLQELFIFGFKADSYEVLDISLRLAKLYEERGNLRKAEMGYKYCVSKLCNRVKGSVDSLEDKTLILSVTALKLCGRFLTNLKKYEEAQKYLLLALDLSTAHNGLKHKETALLLSDVATTAGLSGDLATAITYLEEAVTIGENIEGMEYMPILYYNLGHFYFSGKYYDESSENCEKGFMMAVGGQNGDMVKLGHHCMANLRYVWKHGRT